MDYQVQKQEHASVVTVSGSIDALTADEFTNFLNAQLLEGNTQLVADLSRVDFMSSAGLRAILNILRDLRGQGGDLRLAAASPNIEKTLKMTGFTSILKTFSSVEEAVASFGTKAQS